MVKARWQDLEQALACLRALAYTNVVGLAGESSTIGAIDIGGTKIRMATFTAAKREAAAVHEFATSGSTPAEVLGRAADFFRLFRAEAIGVGCTGPVDALRGRVGAVEFLPGWQGFELVQALQSKLGVVAVMENDCDAAALGELAVSGVPGPRTLVYVSISTGIGAGVVAGGEIYRGVGGVHPEAGHMVLDPTGPECYCGARGCWESLASGPALARSHSSARDAQSVFALARQGEEAASVAVRRFRSYTAQGLGNLLTIFTPDVLVVGGGVMNAAKDFFEDAAAEAVAQAGLVPGARTRFRAAALGQEAVLVGAAEAARRHLASKDLLSV
jgi:glucokinase